MRAVLDTNVLVSATLIRGGTEDRLLRAWQRGAFDLVLSPPILAEIGRTLLYEKLQKFQWMSEAVMRGPGRFFVVVINSSTRCLRPW